MNPAGNKYASKSLIYNKHSGSGYYYLALLLFFSGLINSNNLFAQPEVQPWGNMTGIRIDGQLMEFESSIRVVGKDWSGIVATGKEMQRPKYNRDGDKQIITTSLEDLSVTEQFENAGKGKAKVDIHLVSKADLDIDGVFLCMKFSGPGYLAGSIRLPGGKSYAANRLHTDSHSEYLQVATDRLTIHTGDRQVKISTGKSSVIILKSISGEGESGFMVYLPVYTGDIKKDQDVQQTFTIEASGDIDRKPAHLQLDASRPGRIFQGFGGNFRIQNLANDPQVIDYCLQNMHVAWGRVEMPWRFWQPQKDIDPAIAAKEGKLDPSVKRAMEMAQRLSKQNIPIILSAWFPPAWAVSGKLNFRHVPGGEWGNPLNRDSLQEIYKSIADYIVYLKENYGAEVKLFSFNESDLGINVRQTPQEHADLIKGLGAYFEARGLKTRMLLGDNSDATTYEFIYPAMNDSIARRYIGAVSFHSWRGWETSLLNKWSEAATKLDVPLIVAEGSIDAAAWNYPAIFGEAVYAMEEINLYVRLLAICQPLSILQWQLTSDYSPLTGAGIFGTQGPLRPTRRFWNLKQLAATPENLNAMPIACDRPCISCAALGNNETHTYTIHLVNNGATRKVILKGLPKNLTRLKIFVTDQDLSMKEGNTVKVADGVANFDLLSNSYTTLISD